MKVKVIICKAWLYKASHFSQGECCLSVLLNRKGGTKHNALFIAQCFCSSPELCQTSAGPAPQITHPLRRGCCSLCSAAQEPHCHYTPGGNLHHPAPFCTGCMSVPLKCQRRQVRQEDNAVAAGIRCTWWWPPASGNQLTDNVGCSLGQQEQQNGCVCTARFVHAWILGSHLSLQRESVESPWGHWG